MNRRHGWRVLPLVLLGLMLGCERAERSPEPSAGSPPSAGESESAPEAAVPEAPLASAGCRSGEDAQAVRAERREVTVGDETRAYWIDVPRGPTDEARPLVMVFHRFQGRPRRLRRWSGFGRLAHRNRFIAVFPEGHEGVELLDVTGVGWDIYPHQTRDLVFVEGLLDVLERDLCVDRRRVYVAGLSNGGFFANVLGCRLAERLAGMAAVAGSMPLRECTPARPVRALLIHGESDKVVKVDIARAARDWWVRANGCGEPEPEGHCRHYRSCQGADVSYCEGPQGHRWPRPAARRIWRFFDGPPT